MVADRNQVLQDYRKWLYFMANHLAGSHAEVDDLAQEGYIAMWRALGTFDPDKGALATWLTKAARMRMTDIARGHGQPLGHVGIVASPGSRRDSRDTRPPATGQQALEGMLPGELDAFERSMGIWLDAGLDLSYHRGQIAAALAALPEDMKTYVVLRFWHGMTATEIQPLVQGNVTHLWRGAREQLRDRLQHLAA